jgi:hypothetical protein
VCGGYQCRDCEAHEILGDLNVEIMRSSRQNASNRWSLCLNRRLFEGGTGGDRAVR